MTKPIAWSKLPIAQPDGSLLPYISARMRTAEIDALYINAGGHERALAWINASDENYGEFFIKVYARGTAKVSSVEVGVSGNVEDMRATLDSGEHARVVGDSD